MLKSTQRKVWQDSGIKNLSEYFDLYAQNNTVLWADVFENVHNKCIKTFELDHVYFLPAPELSWQECLEKIEVKIVGRYWNATNGRDKGVIGGMSHAIQWYTKANKNILKIMI